MLFLLIYVIYFDNPVNQNHIDRTVKIQVEENKTEETKTNKKATTKRTKKET